MASTRRRPHASLKSDLFEQFQSFELFQAIRLLETLAVAENREAGLDPVEPVGRTVDPRKASLRIRSAVPLSFAATELTAVRRAKNGGPIEITQTLVGLTGPSGVLPHMLSELVQVSVRERNPALRDFLDVFNNRLAALLFEAWAKYRPVIERERRQTVGTPHPIDHALKSLVGLGFSATADRTSVPDATFVSFGGLLARQARSALAVERSMSGALGHVVRVEQFVGEWLAIAPADRTRLPAEGSPEGSFARLGHDAVIGERVFDIQSSVMIVVGPLGYEDFRTLLPDGARAHMLTDLAAQALGPDKTFRIRLELKAGEVPGVALQPDPQAPEASRLGWNTWLAPAAPRNTSVTAEFHPLPHLR